MLVCIGYDATFVMVDAKNVRGRSLLFDPTGIDWPRCSVLVRTFTRTNQPMTPDGFTRKWFGADYELLEGQTNTPSRDISDWNEVGPVAQILYTRGSGDRRRKAKHAGHYEHVFGQRGLFDFFSLGPKKLPILYRRGADLRLELGRGCSVTGRGFEAP